MDMNYKMLQLGSGMIRYMQDSESGQFWFALTDVFNALQLPPRLRDSSLFEEREVAQQIFHHDKLKKPVSLISITQSGLLKVIWRSDDIIFRAFKTWLAEAVLNSMYGSDYLIRLMPYVQSSYDPNTLPLSIGRQELPVVSREE